MLRIVPRRAHPCTAATEQVFPACDFSYSARGQERTCSQSNLRWGMIGTQISEEKAASNSNGQVLPPIVSCPRGERWWGSVVGWCKRQTGRAGANKAQAVAIGVC